MDDASDDKKFQEILDSPLPVEMRSFGDQLTLTSVLRLTVKIVEPPDKAKRMGVLRWFENGFVNLKERMQQPRRAALRRRLRAIADQASKVLTELEDFEIISRLVDAEWADRGSCNAADVERRRCALKDHARFASIAADKIPVGKGDRRADGDVSPEELCAFMVRQAWRVGRGEEPGSQSIDVLAACESLWIAAGGKASKDADARKWRRHLEAASLPRRQGASGAHFITDGNGHNVLVEVRLPPL